MKSYWIAATLLFLTSWPSGSKACVTGIDQVKADDQPVLQPQSSNPSLKPQQPVEGTVTAKPAGSSLSAETPAAAASAQSKGSYLLVELSKTLKAKKLKRGDKVKAEVTQDVISHGKVIIPVETELVGHVTEVSVREGANGESRLGLVFDRILLKHYRDVTLQAVVQAVAPPVIKKSRVDQPSQMLPPSMMGGGQRSNVGLPGGRSTSASRTPNSGGSGGGYLASDASSYQVPLTVKQSPSTHAQSGSTAAQLELPQGGKPLSIGMPQGVTGLKGLALSTVPSNDTPGPVIVSNTDNVKLDSGTQILLHVLTVETPVNTQGKK
jgi:biotin carboxyl carrier protein